MNDHKTIAEQASTDPTRSRIAALTALAMFAFALNSLLTRAALGPSAIDAVSFALVRLLSGAAMLLFLTQWRRLRPAGSWSGAFFLYLYALPFSIAYLTLQAGTGALILFGSVQFTMFAAALRDGERPGPKQWLWTITACFGLVLLVLPGVRAPQPVGALLMAIAGIAWGLYSIKGRSEKQPLAASAGNFIRSAPLVGFTALVYFQFSPMQLSWFGLGLATLSGAVTSGLGYALWYSALSGLRASVAATVQLTVPVLAAIMGLAFLDESISLRLTGASALVLGGVAGSIHVAGRKASPQ